jgi:hypothetical protein
LYVNEKASTTYAVIGLNTLSILLSATWLGYPQRLVLIGSVSLLRLRPHERDASTTSMRKKRVSAFGVTCRVIVPHYPLTPLMSVGTLHNYIPYY